MVSRAPLCKGSPRRGGGRKTTGGARRDPVFPLTAPRYVPLMREPGRTSPTDPTTDRDLTRDVAGFLAFSHGWTWLLWALAAGAGASVWEPPGLYFFVPGGAGVMIGGVVMTRVAYGAVGLRDLGRRMVDPRRATGRWWAVVLLFFPALTVVAAALAGLGASAGIDGFIGSGFRPLDLGSAAALLADPAGLLAMIGFLLVIGPLPEEVGWRGYLQDRLQARWSALASSLAVGMAWWSWHLPLFLVPGFFDVFHIATPTPLGFLAGILPSAVLYAWIYNNTRRSVLAVIIFHFMQNFSGELLALSAEARVVQVLLLVVAAAGVVWGWGASTLARGRLSPRPPGRAGPSPSSP